MPPVHSTRHFLSGVGSLLDFMPASDPYADARAQFRRRLPDMTGYQIAPPGKTDDTIQTVTSIVAWALFLSGRPDVVAAYPDDVSRIEEALTWAEQTPPVVENFSSVGHLWVDAVRLAEDRYRVRQRLVAQGRQLVAQIRAASHAPA